MAAHFPPNPPHVPTPNDHYLPETPFREYAQSPSQRIAGWSGEKQALFLQALAEGLTVHQGCRLVGLSPQSAYAFRHSARGAQFAIGWQAALLKARDTLADVLMDRALHGTVETITRSDGSEVERHRHDNRLGMAMLNRLDRMADRGARESTHAAARLVVQDFAQYLELIGRDPGPARAGLFLAERIEPAQEADLAPLRALARADAWLRGHTDLAEPIADLDPDARADWSGADWNRAEAAGLVQLAPVSADQPNQHFSDDGVAAAAAEAAVADDEPVWWDEEAEEWRTHFPPPEDFDGEEAGRYGTPEYERSLSSAELARVEAEERAALAVRRAAETAARERWFAELTSAV